MYVIRTWPVLFTMLYSVPRLRFFFFVGNVSGDLMSDGQQCPALRTAILIMCAAQKTPEYILIGLF